MLIDALNHPDDEEFEVPEVPAALARFGSKSGGALPILIGLARKRRDEPDLYRALVHIDPEGKECVRALASALNYGDYEHEYHAVDVATNYLGLLGPRAKDAVPALAAAMTRDYKETFFSGYDPQISAAKALRRIGPDARSAVPALIAAVKYRRVAHDPIDGSEYRDCAAAAAAAEALASLGAEAKAAIPALIEAAQTHENSVGTSELRVAAIRALGEIGHGSETTIPILRSLLKEEEKSLRYVSEIIVAVSIDWPRTGRHSPRRGSTGRLTAASDRRCARS